MQTAILIFSFIFGSIFGSFLNVVATRFGTGRTILGRSRCDATGQVLSWHELIPVVSYILQGGKSKRTGTKISPQYVLTEVGVGIVFTLLASKFLLGPTILSGDMLNFFFSIIVASILIVIFIYDVRHMVIPDEFSGMLASIAFLGLFFYSNGQAIDLPTVKEFLAGPILAFPFYALWKISDGKWIGLGDAKLQLGLGWIAGMSVGFFGMMMAFWIGALVGLVMIGIYGRKNIRVLPFAPFLIIGFAVAFFTGLTMTDFLMIF